MDLRDPVPWGREQAVTTRRREEDPFSALQAIPLPCEVVAAKATASRRSGMLTVTPPKAPSARRPVHRIEVTSK